MSVPALAQRARGAIGLRGRIVAVVLITTVATLAIAAVLVLGPLEKSLRRADEQALKKTIPHNVVKRFGRLPLGDLNTSGQHGAAPVGAGAAAAAGRDRRRVRRGARQRGPERHRTPACCIPGPESPATRTRTSPPY